MDLIGAVSSLFKKEDVKRGSIEDFMAWRCFYCGTGLEEHIIGEEDLSLCYKKYAEYFMPPVA